MTSRERKLLRKQINLKLKCLANKESKENDFSNSSQIITERQQRYMTISRHFRAQDNCRKSKKLPFDVEKTSLPHVNVSLLNRLYESTNNVMESENFDKILRVHSFRTKTPFYTNPELTLDRGKVMNYSAHIGAVLHTPRYIEFIKNTPEYISTKKSQQPLGAGKQNRFPVSGSFSFSTTPVASDSRTESNCSESQMSSLYSEKKKNKKQKDSVKSKTSSKSRKKEEYDKNKEIKSNTTSVHQDSVLSLYFLENEENLEPEDVIKSSRASSITSSIKMKKKIDEKEAKKSKLITVERNVETSLDPPRKKSSDMNGSILSNDDLNDMGNIWSGKDGENSEKNKETKQENRDLEIDLKFMKQESFDENEEMNQNLESREKSSTRSSLKSLMESDVHKKEKLEMNSFTKLKEKKVIDEYKNNSIGHSLPEEPSKADSLTTPKEKRKGETKFPESLTSKVVLDGQIAIDENEMANSSEDSLDDVSETGSKYGFIVPKVEDFFKGREINKKDFDLIHRFFDMVDKYRFSRPKYVKDFGVHLLKNNSAHFLDFHNILLSHKIKNINEDESECIKNIIKKIGLENTNLLTLEPYTRSRMEQITQHNPKTNNTMNMDEPQDEETKEIDIISEEEVKEIVNNNIINTIKRIFPVEDIDKYDIKIETEGLDKGESIENEDDIEAEDFAESFRNLFRNSITVMNSNELGDLKRLVAEYKDENKNERITKDVEKENDFLEEFKELLEKEKKEMSEEDFNKLQSLIENDLNDSESEVLKKFDLLLKTYNQQISDEALTKISALIRTEKENLRRLSLSLSNDKEELMEEKEETEVMLAFRNLFKSSIGEINKYDLEKIQRIINEHEMEESQ